MDNLKAVLHGEIMAMVQEGQISAEKYVSISELRSRINKSVSTQHTTAVILYAARDAGYLCYRLAEDDVVCLEKSIEQIDALKTNWAKDPCWDIEETEGFEAYAEELRAWRSEREARIDGELKEKKEKRVALMREQTGVLDAKVAAELHTWSEIEFDIQRAVSSNFSLMELTAAQARATLLQAAQTKRVADALEALVEMTAAEDSRLSLAESFRINGTGE